MWELAGISGTCVWRLGAVPPHCRPPWLPPPKTNTSVQQPPPPLPTPTERAPRPWPLLLQWLSETRLLYQLLDKLAPDQPVEAQNNAAEILAAIAQSQVSPLTRNLAGPEFIEQLFQRALAPEGGVVTHALNVCIALLEPLPQEQQLPPSQLAAADAPSADTQAKLRQQAIKCISQSVGQLVAMLDDAPHAALETPFGVVEPPMGSSRLKAVELLAVLMRTGDAVAGAERGDQEGQEACGCRFGRGRGPAAACSACARLWWRGPRLYPGNCQL